MATNSTSPGKDRDRAKRERTAAPSKAEQAMVDSDEDAPDDEPSIPSSQLDTYLAEFRAGVVQDARAVIHTAVEKLGGKLEERLVN